MPVDYSKWDSLELSDDSDIEVHPNVDKRSFIRAKQNQIHQERTHRKAQIETLKYERQVNDGLLTRIDKLLTSLESHQKDTDTNPDQLVFQALMETADPENDQPPRRPEGVHFQEQELPTYSKMMATLIDQVKAEVDSKKAANRYESYITEVKDHHAKVADLQKQLHTKLAELEKEEGRKITSESIHTGFDSSYVNKAKELAPDPAKTPTPKKNSKKETVVEVLNPGAMKQPKKPEEQSSGADADIDESSPQEDDDEDVEASELGKQFAQVKLGDYRKSLEIISKHPELLAERETDGLLVLAFNSQLSGQEDFARQCVHQALLLQYCRALGRDGVGLFFKRVTTPNHQAQKVFLDDVNTTYDRIRSRVKEIKANGGVGGDEQAGGVEQIQLHAVDPGTTINISIPPKNGSTPEEQHGREIFESFPPGLQRALESGSLDEVNKVLGKMSVEEAEEIVGQLSEGGMLSVEEQIIDATTEEGQAALKQFEEQERAAATAEGQAEASSTKFEDQMD